MNEKFTLEDILYFVINIKKDITKFFMMLKKGFSNEQLQNVFDYLIEAENNQEKQFTNLLNVVNTLSIKPTYEWENQLFLKDLVLIHSLSDGKSIEKLTLGIKTESDAINMAIQFYKDSVVFFSTILEFVVTDPDGIIDRILKESIWNLRKLLLFKKKTDL